MATLQEPNHSVTGREKKQTRHGDTCEKKLYTNALIVRRFEEVGVIYARKLWHCIYAKKVMTPRRSIDHEKAQASMGQVRRYPQLKKIRLNANLLNRTSFKYVNAKHVNIFL